jgi:hypothetical protein
MYGLGKAQERVVFPVPGGPCNSSLRKVSLAYVSMVCIMFS